MSLVSFFLLNENKTEIVIFVIDSARGPLSYCKTDIKTLDV